jgi:hypothetical protein
MKTKKELFEAYCDLHRIADLKAQDGTLSEAQQ